MADTGRHGRSSREPLAREPIGREPATPGDAVREPVSPEPVRRDPTPPGPVPGETNGSGPTLRKPSPPGPSAREAFASGPAGAEPIRFPRPEIQQEWIPASQELLTQLQRRWEDLKARLESTTSTVRRTLAMELREDAEYVRVRARYYHERKPLQTLGVVAASAFVLGMVLGFGRR